MIVFAFEYSDGSCSPFCGREAVRYSVGELVSGEWGPVLYRVADSRYVYCIEEAISKFLVSVVFVVYLTLQTSQ